MRTYKTNKGTWSIPLAGSRVRFYRNGDGESVFKTDDERLIKAIETSPYFGKSIFLKHSDEKQKIKRTKIGSLKGVVKEETAPVIE